MSQAQRSRRCVRNLPAQTQVVAPIPLDRLAPHRDSGQAPNNSTEISREPREAGRQPLSLYRRRTPITLGTSNNQGMQAAEAPVTIAPLAGGRLVYIGSETYRSATCR